MMETKLYEKKKKKNENKDKARKLKSIINRCKIENQK